MRSKLYAVGVAVLLTNTAADCCGVGGPELQPRSADTECTYFDCPIAVGGEVSAYIAYVEPERAIEGATIADPLATVEVVDGGVVIRPYAVGQSTLAVDIGYESDVMAWIETAELASTAVELDPTVARRKPGYPAGRLQMFAGSTVRVVAAHRDASGRRLLGHGFESWTIEGGMLAPVTSDPEGLLDQALVRDVVATTEPLITTGARAGGKPLELEVVPAGSTAQLRLTAPLENLREQQVLVRNGAWSWPIEVDAFSADRRYIHGNPVGEVLAVEIADAGIAAIEVDPANRAFRVRGIASGTTSVMVRFDGRTERFMVTVP